MNDFFYVILVILFVISPFIADRMFNAKER